MQGCLDNERISPPACLAQFHPLENTEKHCTSRAYTFLLYGNRMQENKILQVNRKKRKHEQFVVQKLCNILLTLNSHEQNTEHGVAHCDDLRLFH